VVCNRRGEPAPQDADQVGPLHAHLRSLKFQNSSLSRKQVKLLANPTKQQKQTHHLKHLQELWRQLHEFVRVCEMGGAGEWSQRGYGGLNRPIWSEVLAEDSGAG
jgi:hypothetical protein